MPSVFLWWEQRDLVIITTPPPNRYPVTTGYTPSMKKWFGWCDWINWVAVDRFSLYTTRVQDIHDIAAMIQKLLPGTRIAVGHGQMDGDKLEEVLMDFVAGQYDVLVATTIIESGFGYCKCRYYHHQSGSKFPDWWFASDERKGRKIEKKAFCYLLAPPPTVLQWKPDNGCVR